MNKEKPENITKDSKQEEAKLETLPAVEVRNEVVWVNDKVAMPFVFEEGKPSKLGVFLTPKPKEGEPTFSLGVMDEHFRSANLGKVIFQDKENPKLQYRDVDLKGVGGTTLDKEGGVEELRVEPLYSDTRKVVPYGKGIWGIMNPYPAEYDRDMSELFIKKGLRTHRALAIIKLKELIDPEGNKISLKTAAERGYIKTSTKPVVEVRAFGVKSRINDVFRSNNKKEKVELLLKDAREMVAGELGKKLEGFSVLDYIDWFATTLGEQVAILHRNGYSHGFLTAHNITLDCRIVDLDSLESMEGKDDKEKRKDISRDLKFVKKTFGYFVSMLGFHKEIYNHIFTVSYNAKLTK